MPSETYFIKVKTSRMVFPSTCPVCGDPADDEGAIPIISAADRKVADEITRHTSFAAGGYYAPRGSARKFARPTPLMIPTCGRHAVSFQDMARFRAPCGIIGGLLFVGIVFLGISTLLSYSIGYEVPPTNLLYIGLGIFGLLVINSLAGLSGLEKAVKVIDGDANMGHLILRIKNQEYAEEFLQLNAMTAERVNPN